MCASRVSTCHLKCVAQVLQATRTRLHPWLHYTTVPECRGHGLGLLEVGNICNCPLYNVTCVTCVFNRTGVYMPCASRACRATPLHPLACCCRSPASPMTRTGLVTRVLGPCHVELHMPTQRSTHTATHADAACRRRRSCMVMGTRRAAASNSTPPAQGTAG